MEIWEIALYAIIVLVAIAAVFFFTLSAFYRKPGPVSYTHLTLPTICSV